MNIKCLAGGLALAGAMASLLLLPHPAAAASVLRGSISFTEEQRTAHGQAIQPLLKTAATCLEGDLSRHLSFYNAHGFSPFYGDRSQFGRLSHAGKRQFLQRMGVSGKLLDKMEPTSCVGLLLKCLGKGFAAAKQGMVGQRIREYTLLNNADGTALQEALQKLGWKLHYWNPDVRMNATWDRREKAKDPGNRERFWGYHEYNWHLASKRGLYGFTRLDDARLLVNFGDKVPEALKTVPFWVGTAHGGYHVFPGMGGRVVEAHSTRRLTDIKTLQADPFNPLNGEAPTDGMYFSGVIALPPGSTP